MKLYRIRGGTESDLLNKKYSIGVGISLGNRWFTPENIISLVEWSLKYSKGIVMVYVADTIHAINIEVRYRKNLDKSLSKAVEMGANIISGVKKIADNKFTHEENERIIYATWDDLSTPKYCEKVNFLYEKFSTDKVFKVTLIELVEDLTREESRLFTHEDKLRFCDYLIEELPEILTRVPIKGFIIDAYVYPFDGKVTQLAEKIQRGQIFPEIGKKIIDTEPKVFLEVR